MAATMEAPAPVGDEERIGAPRPTDAARLAEIVVVLARNGLLTVSRRGGALAVRPRRQAPRAVAVALRRSFADLGPTYVKFGQLIASSPGLFPAFLATEFRRLLDAVPPESPAKIRRVIERELDASIDDLFATFDDTPVAAASVAQVHRATLADGTEVAVKVRRPNLRGRIEQDLRLLRLLASALARAGALGETLNPTAIVDDLASTIRAELDFRREAAAMTEFATNLARHATNQQCVVPRPIEGMVAERVLVMTYVEGTPVDDGTTLRAAGHDLEDLVRTGVRAWLGGALEHGLFHGDVHAGNLWLLDDGRATYLDFGIMGELTPDYRSLFRDLQYTSMIDGDYTRVVKAWQRVGVFGPEIDVESTAAMIKAMYDPMLDMPIGQVSLGELMKQQLDLQDQMGLRAPREFVLITKQLLYFERYAKVLAPYYAMSRDLYLVKNIFPDEVAKLCAERGIELPE